MIDWVSCSLPYDGPPLGVQYLRSERRLDPVTKAWRNVVEPAFNRPVKVEGSFSSSLQVQAMGGRLYLHGNPVKWLTGQNVAGTNDLRRLISETLDRVIDRLGLWECPTMLQALRDGNVTLTRVDCTFSYRVGSDEEAVTWLEAMERSCNVRFRGRGHFDQGMCSLAWGYTQQEGQKSNASRRSTFKFYNKWREMAVHRPTCDERTAAQLREDVWGAVRGEACYRGIELKRLKYERLSAWDEGTALKLHRDWVDRMEMAETYTLKSETERDLPRHLQLTYRLWLAGEDVRSLLHRQAFWRHRRDLMGYGIDISQPRIEGKETAKVIPILRVLEAKPIAEQDHEALFWRLLAAA